MNATLGAGKYDQAHTSPFSKGGMRGILKRWLHTSESHSQCHRRDILIDACADLGQGDFHLEVRLQSQPEFRARPKVAGQTQTNQARTQVAMALKYYNSTFSAGPPCHAALRAAPRQNLDFFGKALAAQHQATVCYPADFVHQAWVQLISE